jgi:hypothetical protein
MTRRFEQSAPRLVVDASQLGIAYATASKRTGRVLSPPCPSDAIQSLAATLPELLGTLDRGCFERIAERLGAEPDDQGCAELLFFSEHLLHVIRPLSNRSDQALLAVSPAESGIGLVLSEVHARAAQLEEEE